MIVAPDLRWAPAGPDGRVDALEKSMTAKC
jgi:hypothetical protein